MTRMSVFYLFTIAALVGSCTPSAEDAPADEPMEPTMSFFLTSAGPGNGAALGGVQGADRYCQSLADAVGAGVLFSPGSQFNNDGRASRCLRLTFAMADAEDLRRGVEALAGVVSVRQDSVSRAAPRGQI